MSGVPEPIFPAQQESLQQLEEEVERLTSALEWIARFLRVHGYSGFAQLVESLRAEPS